MASFISKQPNGLYCRFSTVVDCPTNWNMTEDDYIRRCMEEARIDALETLENHLRPFEEVIENFYPTNMTEEEFENLLKEMGVENN